MKEMQLRSNLETDYPEKPKFYDVIDNIAKYLNNNHDKFYYQ